MNRKNKKLFIVDGYAILYRAHYALIRNPLITSYGLHTSALYGFSNQLFKILNDEKPDYFLCAFDSKEKTFRHDIYPEYKANRPEMPEELQLQLPHLWDLLEAMKIPVLKKPGFEADDIIGTIVDSARKKKVDSYIVSGDKDFMQLINENIFLYTPGRRNESPTIYDKNGVIKKWGLPPEKIIDLLALMGDSSDNVPGVLGVGVKTAVKLLNEFDTLNGVLENAHKVTNKRVKNGLINSKEIALLSKDLVTIDKNVDIEFSFENFKLENYEFSLLTKKYEELEFYALLKQLLNTNVSNSKKEIKKKYISITSKSDLIKLVNEIKKVNLLSIDLETTSVNPIEAEIVGISISIKKNCGFYIPVIYPNKKDNHFGKVELDGIFSILEPILIDEKIKKIGQNIKYDTIILLRHGIYLKGIHFDTMIAAHIINPSSRSYKLDNLSIEYLNYNMVPIEELIGRGKDQITMDKVPLEKITNYASEDADIVLQLYKIFFPLLEENKQLEYFFTIEMPMVSVLTRMELEGVYIDKKMLEEMSIEFGTRLDKIVEEIYKISGTEFNINSTQQLANILFDQLNLNQIKKRSTAENVLTVLAREHDLPKLILDYRKLNKLKNTYIDSLPILIDNKTSRIHSTFNQTIASTGRLSSINPNFQNIPVRSEDGKRIRKAFITQKKGWKILSADYSQIELRIMAHLSKDPELCSAFNNNLDIHLRTAGFIFNVSEEDVIDEMRRTAKVINFGIMYGAGSFRISQELGIPRKDSQKIIDQYFSLYSGIANYIERTLEKARSDNYVETLLGRRRPIWDANSENSLKRKASERIAINTPIQGTAAELIKIAMIDIQNKINEKELCSKMIMQIHDELLFEFPEDEESELISLVVNSMEGAMNLSVPIVVDYGVGINWYEAH